MENLGCTLPKNVGLNHAMTLYTYHLVISIGGGVAIPHFVMMDFLSILVLDTVMILQQQQLDHLIVVEVSSLSSPYLSPFPQVIQ